MSHSLGRFARLFFCAATIVLVAPASAQPSPAQVVRGRVQEVGTSAPIAVVDLAVLSPGGQELARAQSDSAGYFTLRWSGPAEVRLRAQRLGFETSTSSAILVRRDEIVTVRMFMSTTPVQVDPLVVNARERLNDIMGNFAEVERRRKLGFGKFITREQIEQTGNSRILRNVAASDRRLPASRAGKPAIRRRVQQHEHDRAGRSAGSQPEPPRHDHEPAALQRRMSNDDFPGRPNTPLSHCGRKRAAGYTGGNHRSVPHSERSACSLCR